MELVSIAEKFMLLSELWRPKMVASLGRRVKLVKVQGASPWHSRQDADEMFLVWRGRFRVELRGRVAEL